MYTKDNKNKKTGNYKSKTKGYSKKSNTFKRDMSDTNTIAVNPDKSDKYAGGNDPAWYTRYPQLVADSSTLAFATQLGSKIELKSVDGTAMMHEPRSVSGIITVDLGPTLGAPKTATDPINIAARNIYTYVRHANSGSSNYDAPNLMMYLAAMGSLYSYYGYLARIYGLASLYNVKNKYLPRALLECQNVDFDDVIANMANFRAAINMFVTRLSSLATPAGMPYFERSLWLYSGLYADSDTLKAQLYLFRPYAFYQYNEPASGSGSNIGTLTWNNTRLDHTPYTVATLMARAEALLSPVLLSEDFGIMSGDIQKAFGLENLMKLKYIDEGYSVFPEYNTTVLNQIHNSQSLYSFDITVKPGQNQLSADFGKISEDVSQTSNQGALVWTGTVQVNGGLPKYNTILDLDSPIPSPIEVMEATRLMLFTDTTRVVRTQSTEPQMYLYSCDIGTCGNEIVMQYKTWFYHDVGFGWTLFSEWTGTYTNHPYSGDWFNIFSKAPIQYLMERRDDQNVRTYTIRGHLDNYTYLDKETFRSMNTVAQLSLFDVPRVGAWKNN